MRRRPAFALVKLYSPEPRRFWRLACHAVEDAPHVAFGSVSVAVNDAVVLAAEFVAPEGKAIGLVAYNF